MSTFVVPQIRSDVPRSYSYPTTTTKRRRKDTFVERLLKDPMLQTMADIGKQEGTISPLPAPQRARTINTSQARDIESVGASFIDDIHDGAWYHLREHILFSSCPNIGSKYSYGKI
ncbi:4117_t:CDS:2 [Cetraspora pellucida]|uniref:4117_t:CDS:1 n=1 Tax=Cetraspora pellucida TaxID=1433469 RepID=A0A9N9G2S6_9GLOM|nr:4117_t:CDS:2 [Cetraspora pellucida]